MKEREKERVSATDKQQRDRMSSSYRMLNWLRVHLNVNGDWQQAASSHSSDQTVAGSYVCQWRNGDTLLLTLRRRDGKSFEAARVRVEIGLPLLNFSRVLVPDCGRHYINSAKSLDIRAPLYSVMPANAGHPFMALSDESGRFGFGFGLISATGAVQVRRQHPLISTHKALVGGEDHLVLHMEYAPLQSSADELTVELFATEQRRTWFHALRRYTQVVREREEIVYPKNEDAWRPTWCSWTAFSSDDLSEQRLLENGEVARELGIGSLIIDDGWFGPGLDSEIEPLNIGDYRPDPEKFDDLPVTVARLQELGLKVLLWHAPLCAARTSDAYRRMQRYMIHQNGEEFTSVNGLAQLCPACPDVRDYVAEETRRLLTDYGVDGLKADLYNCLAPDACDSPHHAHDIEDPVEALRAAMAAQWEAARGARPDVLIELKQDYGNVRLLRYGTMVRAGDTAYDVDTNCRRCFYNQSYAACVHNDYLMTSALTEPRALALLMVRMITAGVPTFGNDLTRLEPSQKHIIRRWLAFYRAELRMLRRPREPQVDALNAWQGGSAERAWAAALWECCEVRLPEAPVTFLLNGTGRESLYVQCRQAFRAAVTVYDYHLEPVGECGREITPGCVLEVPCGGMLRIGRG